jgi:hypothetical protein
MPLLLFV